MSEDAFDRFAGDPGGDGDVQRIGIRVIDLVRDPRDVLASIRAFTSAGVDGFGLGTLLDTRQISVALKKLRALERPVEVILVTRRE